MKVGVLGGGQLARMLAQAGRPLGVEFIFFCPDPHACAAPLGEHYCAGFDDESTLARLAEQVDIVTYEFENVPLQAVRFLSERVSVQPPTAALAVAQDRLHEKHRFHALDIPTPAYEAVDNLQGLHRAVGQIGLPAILKTRTQGYDGKGQAVLRTPQDLALAWEQLGVVPAIVEAQVPFEREISIIAIRSVNGESVFYPVSENYHREGTLRLSLSRSGDALQPIAESYARRILESLDYVGALALELFQVDGRLLANEIAPRVHNSGHWTIEGADTSQFENHLRAILGWPLGSIAMTGSAAMVNLIGTLPPEEELLAVPGAALHLYGKSARPGRKLGHVTLTSMNCTPREFNRRLSQVLLLAGEPELATRVSVETSELSRS
jgi:5-(carboxyamino)imidazole ribonucleotide synthase